MWGLIEHHSVIGSIQTDPQWYPDLRGCYSQNLKFVTLVQGPDDRQ